VIPRPASLAVAALLALAPPAAAQQPIPRPVPAPTAPARDTVRPPADTTARPRPAADSVVRDSSDTVRAAPDWPGTAPTGPLPRGRRLVFDQDAIQLSGALTLADLLREVPGVFVMRGGFYGQAEPVMYGGRSGVGPVLEILWDGLVLDPLGRDSLFVDPARVPLAFVERVEILIEPSRVRVDVTSLEDRLLPARSQIRVVTGDDDIAEYRALFEKRWPTGTGVAAGADYNNIARTGLAQGAFTQSSIWLKGQWMPRPTAGVSYQMLRNEVSRDPTAVLPESNYGRTDWLLQLFARERGDGRGWSVRGLLGNQSVSGDSGVADAHLRQAAVTVGYAHPFATLEVEGRARDARTDFELTARLRVRPIARLLLYGEARRSWYDGTVADPHGTVGQFGASLALLGGFSVRGDVTRLAVRQAPALAADTVQRATDVSMAGRWDSRWGSVEVALSQRDPWQAVPYPDYGTVIAAHNPTVRTTTFTAGAALRPTSYLLLTGWYHDPFRGGADLEPPKHFRGSAIFQSKFWRKFRSGVFTLRAELAAELWSTALAGRDPVGIQRALNGATFVETNLQIQIVGATLFYMIRNSNVMRGSYFPTLPYPRNQRVWGVRWVFYN
jgi:TonB-dependent receptor-like protein